MPSRFQLTDFTDKQKLLAFLNYDGNPPIVYKPKGYSFYGNRETTPTPVTDEATLDLWWSDYRSELTTAFLKSRHNLHKPMTEGQFMADCLSSIGIKGGTIKDRIARARAARPDLYVDYATGKAAEDARVAKIREKMQKDRDADDVKHANNLAPPTKRRDRQVDPVVSERQRGAAFKAWQTRKRNAEQTQSI